MINLSEAARLTGKGKTTITRLARKYESTEHVTKEAGKYYISKELVNRFYPVVNQGEHKSNQVNQDKKTGILQAKNETIELLKDQLQQKDSQINQLTERIRENNIVIQNLQSRLQIPESNTQQPPYTEQTQYTEHTEQKDYKDIIIELHKKNYSHRQISDWLNQNGYLNTKNQPWTKKGVEGQIRRMRKK